TDMEIEFGVPNAGSLKVERAMQPLTILLAQACPRFADVLTPLSDALASFAPLSALFCTLALFHALLLCSPFAFSVTVLFTLAVGSRSVLLSATALLTLRCSLAISI